MAMAGVGTVFKRGATPIAEVNSIGGPDQTREQIDTTSLDTVGGYRTYMGSFKDGGEISLELNFSAANWSGFQGDMDASAPVTYSIEFPDGTIFTFDAVCISMGVAVPLDDKITQSVTLKLSGGITVT